MPALASHSLQPVASAALASVGGPRRKGVSQAETRSLGAAAVISPPQPYAAPEPPPPGVISGYSLKGERGEGATSTVYEAEAPDGEPVAVKILKKRAARHPEVVARFYREREISKASAHPNLIRITGSGVSGGLHFLIMDLAGDLDLAEFVDHLDGTMLSEVDLVDLAIGLLAAAESLHQLGFVHLDIKPSNVVLNKTGVPILVDLGLVMEENRSRAGIAHGLGTRGFMAPEIASGDSADRQADLFSIGRTVVFAASNGTYMGRATPPSSYAAIVAEDPAPVRGLVPSLSYEFGGFLDRLSASERHQRPRSATAAIEELRAISRSRQSAATIDRTVRWDAATAAPNVPEGARAEIAAGTPSENFVTVHEARAGARAVDPWADTLLAS